MLCMCAIKLFIFPVLLEIIGHITRPSFAFKDVDDFVMSEFMRKNNVL